MEDKEIIGLYFARSERAIEETAGKYGSFCHGIAYHILGSNEDSKECVNDTYYHVWNVIPPNRPSCFRAFLGKITRNLALGKYRARHAQKRGGGNVALALEELREAASCLPPDEALIEAELVQLIDAFWRTSIRRRGSFSSGGIGILTPYVKSPLLSASV